MEPVVRHLNKKGETMNTLDWKKLDEFIKKRKPVEVSAGILNDWFWTAATVWENGRYRKDKNRAYVSSFWAIPGFKATMKNGDVIEVAAYREETKKEGYARKRRSEIARKQLHKFAEASRKSMANPSRQTSAARKEG